MSTFKWRDLNPFVNPPTVKTLVEEEVAELQRELYLEDKRADHHRANAEAIQKRIRKLADYLGADIA